MIRRPLSYVALVIVLPLGTLMVLAALAAAYRGSDAALALLVVGLVGWTIMLVHNLRQLVIWARQPVGTRVRTSSCTPSTPMTGVGLMATSPVWL